MNKERPGKSITWFRLSERTFSKTPNGKATEVGMLTQDGTFPFKFAILRDLAPTWTNLKNAFYISLICILE